MSGDEQQLPVHLPRRGPWRPRPEPVYDPRIVPIVMPDQATLERTLAGLKRL